MNRVTKEDVLSVIKEQATNVEWDKIDAGESLAEQGVDSLDMINIIFAFQEKYGIEITDESIGNGEWLSIDNMVNSLNRILELM